MTETLESIRPEFEAAVAANPELFDPERVEFIRDLAAAGMDRAAVEHELKVYRPPAYRMVMAGEFSAAKPPAYLVRGAIVEGSVCAMYGQTQAGKTFAAIDLAFCIATGRPWFGHETHQAAVLWIAAEDPVGVQLRGEAWLKHHGVSTNAFAMLDGNLFNLRNPESLAGIIRAGRRVLRTSGLPKLLIVVDTLVRATPGADEISGKDTGEIVAAFDRLRLSLPSTLCVIHHSGKNENAGLRGHSSLGQGVDSFALVAKSGNGSTITFEKVKNSRLPDPIGFQLEVVALKNDADGRLIDSCVVVPREMKPVEVRTVEKTQRAREYIAALDVAIRDGGVPLPQAITGRDDAKGVPTEVWRETVKHIYQEDMKGATARKEWNRTYKSLVELGHVCVCTYHDKEYSYPVDTS